MKITKSKAEIYRISGLQYGGWADITIDEGDKSGRLSISSDWGNWAYGWHSYGRSFKEFLCGLDIHYTAKKMGQANYFDFDATIKAWKREVIEAREGWAIDAKEARELYDQIKVMEFDGTSLEEVKGTLWREEKLLDFFHSMPTIITDIEPAFKNFWERICYPCWDFLVF